MVFSLTQSLTDESFFDVCLLSPEGCVLSGEQNVPKMF